MAKVQIPTFQKGERRKHSQWRAFAVVTGKVTKAGVLVQFDADPLDGRAGQRQFMDAQWVSQSEVLAG